MIQFREPPAGATWQELKRRYRDVIRAYPKAEDWLHDIWAMGAPLPDRRGGRVVLRSKVKQWFDEVNELVDLTAT